MTPLATVARVLDLTVDETTDIIDQLAGEGIHVICDTVTLRWGDPPTLNGTEVALSVGVPSVRDLLSEGWHIVQVTRTDRWMCQSDGLWVAHSRSERHPDGCRQAVVVDRTFEL